MDKSLIDVTAIEKTAFRNIDGAEPEWLYKLRKTSWESYLDSPLPERAGNVWRYTDPADFVVQDPESLQDVLPLLPENSPQDMREMAPEHAAFGYNRSDYRTFAQMVPGLADRGVVFKDLYSAIRENESVREYLGGLIGPDFGKFEAFNLALWNNGLYLYIPANTEITEPIYLHRHPTGAVTIQRLLVVVGDYSRATIIDDYSCHCRTADAISNSAVEIFAGNSTAVRYVNLQRLAPDAKTYITVRSQIGEAADMKSIYGSAGSRITKVNAGTILAGRGANSQMYGVIYGDGKQHFDYHTMHNHKARESFSNLNFKVVLKDRAKSAYTGLIRIEKDAINCEAYQENRNLLLNEGTKAESIPELEILTDQVRCTHGATMGPIDPEMVFYLKSRGITEAEAVRAIVTGYIEPLLTQVPVECADILRNLAREKLEGRGDGKRVYKSIP